MDGTSKILWHLGWNPKPVNVLLGCMAVVGWFLVRHPAGMLLGFLALLLRWRAIKLINQNWQQYLGQAEIRVKEQGAKRLGVRLEDAQCTVMAMGQGKAPFGASSKPEYDIGAVYICDAFFAVYQGARFSLAKLKIQLPAHGDEIYFRHVSAVHYNPPCIEVILSNRKTTKQFAIASEGANTVVEALRARLRGSAFMSATPYDSNAKPAIRENAQSQESATFPPLSLSGPIESLAEGSEERYCYLRLSKIRQLLSDPSVLDALIEQLQIPGEPAVLKRLTALQKTEAIDVQIDHYRRSPTSVWYEVPRPEVLAASIWRAGAGGGIGVLSHKLVQRQIFCGVSEEDDLRIPVARWLKNQGYEPYMEIPLGMGRVDVLGYKRTRLSASGRLIAVELKNDFAQFKRAINQMGTFGEYSVPQNLPLTTWTGTSSLQSTGTPAFWSES